jgi:hypothetical protein
MRGRREGGVLGCLGGPCKLQGKLKHSEKGRARRTIRVDVGGGGGAETQE